MGESPKIQAGRGYGVDGDRGRRNGLWRGDWRSRRQRRHFVDVIEHLHPEGIGGLLVVERYGQIGPHDERHVVGRVVADFRVVAGGLAVVKINRVRSPAKFADAVPVLVALGLARILRLEAVEPAALIFGVEHPVPTSALIQVARSLAVEMTPPAACFFRGHPQRLYFYV